MEVEQTIDITAEERETVLSLLEQYLPRTAAWVYGSRAKWTSRPQSDLDLVVFPTPEQRHRVGDLREAFEESNLPFRVDLFVWDEVPESFRPQIAVEHATLIPQSRERAIFDWRKTRWGDIATLEYGRALRGLAKGSKGEFRVFGTNGPIGWHHEALCEHPSVIVGRKGAYRGIHYSADPFFAIDTAFYLKPKEEMDVRWAFYALLTQDINGMDSGSAIPSTSREDFYSLPVSVPPLAEQRAIAHILGTLDDKIELNLRMNATLEEIAQALFKSWFVEFDPVRAKMERRDTGLPKDIAGQFPDRLVESELGAVPEGWPLSPLSELVTINPKRVLRKGVVAPYLDMANMPTRGHVPASVGDRPYGSGMRFSNGDTLVARITPCLENGKIAFVDFLGDGEVGWGSTEYIVLKPTTPIPDEFAYCLARSARFREFAVKNMSGTSGRQRVPATALSGFRIAVPPPGVVTAFGRAARTLFATASASANQSRTLCVVRDTLLPRLVSGELRVRDAEEFAARIA